MSFQRDAMAALVRLPDGKFAVLGDGDILALQEQITAIYDPPPDDPAFIEIACGTPAVLPDHPPATLPVVMAGFWTGRRAWKVEHDTNMLLTLVDLSTFSVYQARAMDHDKRMRNPPRSAQGEPPEPFMAASTRSSARPFDLLRFVELPAYVRDVAVTLYVYDVASNTACTHFGAPDEDADASPTIVLPTEFLEPAPEDGGDTRLVVPARLVGRDEPVRVHGVIRVRPPLLPAVTLDGEASLRAAVMLMQLDVRSPVMARFDVPAHRVDGRLEASFAFDLRQAAPGEYLGGLWQAYLIVGDQVAGPQALEIEHDPE